MNRIRLLGAVSAGLSLIVVAVALAAPTRTAQLSTATPVFEWDGGPITGTGLVDVSTDDTLVKLAEPGDILIKLTKFADQGGMPDFDIYLYAADANGDPTGSAIGSAEETDNEQETLSVKKLKAGSYVIEVAAFLTVEGTFHGKATLVTSAGSGPTGPSGPSGPSGPTGPTGTVTPTPTATVGPGVDQTPDAAIAKAGKKGFSGTATDDKGVAKVQIAVQRKKGAKCTQLKKPGKFVKQAKCDAPSRYLTAKGTTKWSYKFKKGKRLKKGRYTVFARATDNAGQVQAGYTPANKRAFKVR
jgi:hypothetical protein